MKRENQFCSLVVRVPIHHTEGHGGARRGYVDVDVVSLLYSIGCVLKGTAYQFYIWEWEWECQSAQTHGTVSSSGIRFTL